MNEDNYVQKKVFPEVEEVLDDDGFVDDLDDDLELDEPNGEA